jgi:hypothetical protein
MNRKISVAVGAAAAVAFTGTAYASDLLTINQSAGYLNDAASQAFMPWFVTGGGDCNAAPGDTSTVGCPDHGAELVSQAAGLFGHPNFFSGGDAVPALSGSPQDSWALVAHTTDNPFMSGLFHTDGTSSFFSGLTWACDTAAEAEAGGCFGMGAPSSTAQIGGDDITLQESWIDQIVVGYVTSQRNTDGDLNNGGEGDITLAQNMRVSFNQTAGIQGVGSGIGAHIDHRLEQMVELDGATGSVDNAGPELPIGPSGASGQGLGTNASRQTMQQAMVTDVLSTGNPTSTFDPGDAGLVMMGQLVSQDIEGFFLSCMNCDNGLNGPTHGVTPEFIDVRYQQYTSGWNVVPTITHGGN